MKIEARVELHGEVAGPDLWDEGWGSSLSLNHVICRDVDGTPHTVSEFVWPWTAYSSHKKQLMLAFYYWKTASGRVLINRADVTPEREARIRELQFLMTRIIYFGDGISSKSLYEKLRYLRYIARFAEERSCSVRDVLTQTSLQDACGASFPSNAIRHWMALLRFFGKLDPEKQLGFVVAETKRWKSFERRAKAYSDRLRQFAPLPTRIYAELINNLAKEFDDIEANKARILGALREACNCYDNRGARRSESGIKIGARLIKKYGLTDFIKSRGYSDTRLISLASIVSEVYLLCKMQIHVFSGMRDAEALHLPFHCMLSENNNSGRKHCLIVGSTTKFNKGRRLRTKWVTTERDGFRAIRLAQEFAAVIYEFLDGMPCEGEESKDDFPLFVASSYLPWVPQNSSTARRYAVLGAELSCTSKDQLVRRLCPVIEAGDIAELEEIDPFRAWREEPNYSVGKRWPLTTHQLRRSLAIYANASGLVRLSSLRRQLQHMTREMSMYYGRGSVFCKNFLEDDLAGYREHVAVDWQEGSEEAEMLAFVRDVLNSNEPMFGGAGVFHERQRERGDVMSREAVAKQMKAGLLAYRDGPLGGCTRPGGCENRKGLALIDTACATDGCKFLVGKHSKIVKTIRLKRAAMAHVTPGSITEMMELEELEALERVEQEWRPKECSDPTASTGGAHA
ncbi:MAG TPA: hypothetical protein VLC92_14245 [Rhodocyclaceae bacterium]|nr:hypothetical protein [Rhodocyclaceae bacterium]